MPDSFGAVVSEALAGVKRDAPACAASMARAIGAARVLVHVDDETATVACDGEQVELRSGEPADGPGAATATLTTSSRVLLDLLDGRRTLLGAVESNALRVRARPADAAGLFDALGRFVEGVARGGDPAAVVERFRRLVRDRERAEGGDR